MRSLLEFREKVRLLYSKNEAYILPVLKFLLAFLTLNMVNGRMGYMERIDQLNIVLIASLVCSFMPSGCIVLFGALFSLLHLYTLSPEVALAVLAIYLIIFLVFFRFGSKDSLVLLFTCIACSMNIPYVVPILVGLVASPVAAIPVGCGLVVYQVLSYVSDNAQAISTMGEDEAIAKFRLVVDVILENKNTLILIAAFAVTIIVVYLIRRMSVDYAWSIAMAAGVIVNLVVLLVGDLKYETNLSLAGALVGSILALVMAKILEFFRFCVDYNRTEKVQFEDDEYYYYVKAIPKMAVTAQSKRVKRINAKRSESPYEDEDYEDEVNGGDSYEEDEGRSVVTERTGLGRRRGAGLFPGRGRRSVTIGSESGAADGYEELEDLDEPQVYEDEEYYEDEEE